MPNGNINGELASHGHITGVLTIGAGGTSDYEMLENKPQINGHELIDNQTAHELGLASMQDVSDIDSDIALLSQKLPKNYSTDEQNTGIKWIDGKNIYQKTLHYTELSEYQSKTYFISDLNINVMISQQSIVKLGTAGGNSFYTSPLYENPSYNMGTAVKNNQINVWANGWNFSEVYVTLYYTKNE